VDLAAQSRGRAADRKNLCIPAGHVRIVFSFSRALAKIAPSIDYLLGRAAADSQLQAATSDEIRRPGIFRHIVGILIAHIDDRCANFDVPRPRSDGREQRERRRQLSREVVDTKISSVHSEALRLNREVDGLEERVSR